MANCPSKQLLEQLLHEELYDPLLTHVLTHVEGCKACQETLHRLGASAPGPTQLNLRSALSATDLRGLAAEAEAFFDRLKKTSRAEADPKPEVDGYAILEEIGRGATGVVYRARHLQLNRPVALKLILAGTLLSTEGRQRFRREAQAIARFQHPNIIHIYDVGEHKGSPYLALELVEGTNLARWLGGSPRPARDAAQISVILAQTVDYAHGQGVIHRDLKPANILLQAESASDRYADRSVSWQVSAKNLKITDFGLAKLLSTSEVIEERMTRSGAIMGTPAYVAPEQARGAAAEVGPTADVYSLGVILYELLTGRPPFQGPTPLETLVQAAHQEPVPPSRLAPKTPRDLQTICLKCLEKNPPKRYQTAAELASDLERFLNHEPIHARPVGRVERLLRWVRRNKGFSAAMSAVALSFVLLLVGSLLAAAHFRKLEQEQRALSLEKVELAEEKEKERNKAVTAENRETVLRKQAEKQGEELRENLYFAQMNLVGQAAASPSGVGQIAELLKPWEPAQWEKGRADLRNWEWYYLKGLCHREPLTLSGHIEQVWDVTWRPDGHRLASAGSDGTVRIWDVAEGRELIALKGHKSAVRCVAWNSDGTRLASAGRDGTVRIWNANSGQETLVFRGHTDDVWSVAWSSDGSELASGGADRTVQIWDAATGASSRVLGRHTEVVSSVAWSPDGQRLASSSHDSQVQLWNIKSSEEPRLLKGHVNWVNKVAWSPDGSRLASASNDQTIKLWDAGDGRELLSIHGHTDAVLSIAWSPDGSSLASGSDDYTVKTWAAVGGPATSTRRGYSGRPSSVNWSPSGRHLASASFDGTIKIWDAAARPETIALSGHEAAVESVAWSNDSRLLASASVDKTIRLWDMPLGKPQRILRGHEQMVRSLAWEPQGTQLASASSDETIRIWNTATGKASKTLRGHHGEVFSVAWSPDRLRLASAGQDHTVRVWDVATGEQKQCLQGHNQWVRCVAWSPAGARLASASWDRTVKIWDVATSREVHTYRGHTGEVIQVAWSPDGRCLASASNDQTIKIWDTTTAEPALTLRGHTARVNSVAWSPDGTRLASAGWDRTVKVWDTRNGKETLSFAGQDNAVNAVAWSPDGLTLVSSLGAQTILVHDATPGYIAALAPQYLPALDRRLAKDAKDSADWRLRAEIQARQENWDAASTDARKFFSLNPDKHWLTLGAWTTGPYPEDLKASYAPETEFCRLPSLDAVAQSNPSTLPSWQPLLLNASGFVNFGSLFDRAEHISAYALVRVYALENRQVAIMLGSDDYVRLWLNGRLIHEDAHLRPATVDEDVVPAQLQAGWNTLLAKVVNATGEHALYLRMSDAPIDLRRAASAASH